jgi:putative transposase
MAYDPQKHHRRSVRLQGHDYTGPSAYYITICTKDRACVFGEVMNGALKPTRRGMVAAECWRDIPNHRPEIGLDEFVIMPNHMHGILWVFRAEEIRATQVSPLRGPRLEPGSLGAIVGAYKAAVSRTINKIRPGAAVGLWQPNYFEHIIRDQRGLEALREYTFTNPDRWERDLENPCGDGSDDVQAFIRSLEPSPRIIEGDTSVAPTGKSS